MERLPILPSKNAPSSAASKNRIIGKVGGGILARALGKVQNQSKWSDEDDDDEDGANQNGDAPTAVVVLPSVLQQVCAINREKLVLCSIQK